MVLNRSSGLASTDISGVLFALTGLVVDYSEVERDWPKRYGGGGVRGAGGGVKPSRIDPSGRWPALNISNRLICMERFA